MFLLLLLKTHDKIKSRKTMTNVSSIWSLSLFSLCPFSVPVHGHLTAVFSPTHLSVTLATASEPMMLFCLLVFKSHFFCPAFLLSLASQYLPHSAYCTSSVSYYGFSLPTNAGLYLLILLKFTVIFVPSTTS